jgi:hypothetical protein
MLAELSYKFVKEKHKHTIKPIAKEVCLKANTGDNT